ncbi:3-hydroxyacyl-CoA dehydrogenase NAD-binding domain-containing protein [Amycolatopsis pigmentata]|uniref:3-hydroxyacyl-CoA dehydrogenase NAD-binding domain-containing protein n=1 Tax=Amycolatopsis pigmentata TaxID=450801 RepID=A0ABW5FNC9_9PSEU
MTRTDARPVALLGAGTIGGGWAATYLARGRPVVVADPAPGARERLLGFLEASWPSVRESAQGVSPDVPLQLIEFAAPGEGALRDVALVHESGPEDLGAKREIYDAVESEIGPGVPVLSSSGGLSPSALQAQMAHPERLVVAHPLSPVYALPLVEVLGGDATSAHVVHRVVDHLRTLAKRPVVLRREVPGYLTNRLTFALLREAVHCLAEGVADAQGIEDAVVYGITPRYLREGPIISLALAGGPEGMPAAMRSFAPAIEQWWADLGHPHLTEEVKSILIEAAEQVLAGRPLGQVLARRDEAVVKTMPRLHGDLAAPRAADAGTANHLARQDTSK